MATNKDNKEAGKIWHADNKRIRLQATPENPAGAWQPVPKTRKPNK